MVLAPHARPVWPVVVPHVGFPVRGVRVGHVAAIGTRSSAATGAGGVWMSWFYFARTKVTQQWAFWWCFVAFAVGLTEAAFRLGQGACHWCSAGNPAGVEERVSGVVPASERVGDHLVPFALGYRPGGFVVVWPRDLRPDWFR